jgi:hypothetical protein
MNKTITPLLLRIYVASFLVIGLSFDLAMSAEVDTKVISERSILRIAATDSNREVMNMPESAEAKQANNSLEWSGQYSGYKEAKVLIITTSSQWQEFWVRHFHEPIPEIDFDKQVVACVFLGLKPTGGYQVEFGTPYIKNKMVIPYKEKKPTGIVTQAFTQPFGVKVFERKGALDVVLEEQ